MCSCFAPDLNLLSTHFPSWPQCCMCSCFPPDLNLLSTYFLPDHSVVCVLVSLLTLICCPLTAFLTTASYVFLFPSWTQCAAFLYSPECSIQSWPYSNLLVSCHFLTNLYNIVSQYPCLQANTLACHMTAQYFGNNPGLTIEIRWWACMPVTPAKYTIGQLIIDIKCNDRSKQKVMVSWLRGMQLAFFSMRYWQLQE